MKLITKAGLAVLALLAVPAMGETIPVGKLAHVHGFALVAQDGRLKILMATHSGIYEAHAAGTATRVSKVSHDFMALAADPSGDGVLFGSGHPTTGGNLGLVRSEDAGRTWATIGTGQRGPADFHVLAVSPRDPAHLYGVHDGLQVSRDGGRRWEVVAPLADEVWSLAASATEPGTLYAGTRAGLQRSRDGGRTWEPAHDPGLPATLVRVLPDGTVYAFVAGHGLLRAREPELEWETVNHAFGAQLLRELAVSPLAPDTLFAMNQFGRLLISGDGGKHWSRFAGAPLPRTRSEQQGAALYARHCAACHGAQGVGETYTPANLGTRGYLFAPALDDSAHAWHHTDEQLAKTILDGSQRTPRMRAWKDTLSAQDAMDIVAYIKRLWSERTLACQGPRHMSCM